MRVITSADVHFSAQIQEKTKKEKGHHVGRCPFFRPKSSENQEKKKATTSADSGAPNIWQRGAPPGVWGRSPQTPMNFYGFHIKNTHLGKLFIEKEHAMTAVTMDNAKIFSQLMSKSRNLAKISERLQPLLV